MDNSTNTDNDLGRIQGACDVVFNTTGKQASNCIWSSIDSLKLYSGGRLLEPCSQFVEGQRKDELFKSLIHGLKPLKKIQFIAVDIISKYHVN